MIKYENFPKISINICCLGLSRAFPIERTQTRVRISHLCSSHWGFTAMSIIIIPVSVGSTMVQRIESIRLVVPYCNVCQSWCFYQKIYEPTRQKTYLRHYAPSEDSDQTAHSRSLIRIFTGRIRVPMYNEDWSVCANAHANLSLCWAYVIEGTFSHVTTHILCKPNACNDNLILYHTGP